VGVVVAGWTGSRADALRQALRMTNEGFAEHLGVAVRTVAYWRERADVVPRPTMQAVLDTALAQASSSTRNQFALLLAEREDARPTAPPAAWTDATSLAEWVTATNTSDAAVARIEQAAAALGEKHTQAPAREVLAEVQQLQGTAQSLLRGGRQRLQQTRELSIFHPGPEACPDTG
jgi:hypothetical protein